LTARFGGPVAKISLDAGLTCPNRDGAISNSGCLFCNERGSGSGAWGRGEGIAAQIDRRLGSGGRARRFIGYFQSFTNTYAPVDRLARMWDEALSRPEMIGLSVGTRPDCLWPEVLDLLAGYRPDREVWLELGLQSASDRTLASIGRGHTVSDFRAAAEAARRRDLAVVAHVILGLPEETWADARRTADFLTDVGVDGVKLHSLYVARGARLADWFRSGRFQPQSRDQYADWAARFLEAIPPGVVIHRLTGDPAPGELIAPDWAADKHGVLAAIRGALADADAWQGKALGFSRAQQIHAIRSRDEGV
jgi:hypothetical protein